MKTISVSNGDIQLNSGKIQFVSDANKLFQELSLWLREPLGTGFTTPGYGSTLYQYIGQPLTAENTAEIQTEIVRVLQLYQANQVQRLKTAQNQSQLSLWSKGEIIQAITNLETYQYNNSIVVNLSVRTLQNSNLDLGIVLDLNGIQVYNG